ncbi:hypothetical protein EMIT0196MI5_90156 [Pseudomonas sp. IT-196MI5]
MHLPHPCRDLQAFSAPHSRTQPPAWTGLGWGQVCRKNDTFSPQAWRGDDCARQVLTELPTAAALGKLLNAEPHTGRYFARNAPMCKDLVFNGSTRS